jgi:hypothetical protein
MAKRKVEWKYLYFLGDRMSLRGADGPGFERFRIAYHYNIGKTFPFSGN